jgi:creatinine amidohydrolase
MAVTDFAHADRETLNDLAARGAVLVLPVGATEQHGPHLATGTDALMVEDLVAAAAQAVGRPVVLAPCLPYGSSGHHLPFGATLSVSTATYLQLLMDLGGSAVRSGFHHVMVVNGHGGNHELVQLAVRDLALRHPDCSFAAGSWWAMAAAAIAAAAPGLNVPGHAGAFETSLMLARRPGLVGERPGGDESEITGRLAHNRSGTRWERGRRWPAGPGWTDAPGRAAAAVGADVFEAATAAVAEEIRRFVADAGAVDEER